MLASVGDDGGAGARRLCLLFLGQAFLDQPALGFVLSFAQQFPIAPDVLLPDESFHGRTPSQTAEVEAAAVPLQGLGRCDARHRMFDCGQAATYSLGRLPAGVFDVGKRVAIYLRVSTSEQTTANQRRELQRVASRHGWAVVGVFEDAGISGAKGRHQRPGLDAMMKAIARREVDMVAAWSVDRLGRSLIDLLDFLRELHAKDVDLFLHQQGLDTSTPSGRAMFQMMGVFAEFERAMIRERVLAGLARAREQGTRLGRRRLEDTDAEKVIAIRRARTKGTGIRRIARDLGVGVGTVLRVTGAA